LHQDIAYNVQEGFIGEVFLKEKPAAEEEPVKPDIVKPSVQQKAARPDAHARTQPHLPAAKPSAAPKSAPAAKPKEQKKKTEEDLSDEEMLVKFLLNNL
jgi:hypothetical protein